MIQSDHIGLPDGLGSFTAEDGGRWNPGVASSEVVSLSHHHDWLAAVRWPRHFPVRPEPVV
jgi:hypothetical protein